MRVRIPKKRRADTSQPFSRGPRVAGRCARSRTGLRALELLGVVVAGLSCGCNGMVGANPANVSDTGESSSHGRNDPDRPRDGGAEKQEQEQTDNIQPLSGEVTYLTHIEPLSREHCVVCHSVGGIAEKADLSTYESWVDGAAEILASVEDGSMPLDKRRWSDRDISLIAAWIDAGKLRGTEKNVEDESSENGEIDIDTGLAPEVLCDDGEETPASSYTRRIKNLMTGLPVTPDELRRVSDDPSVLPRLIDTWFDTPEFRAKLIVFLSDSLQQASGELSGGTEYGPQVTGADRPWFPGERLLGNLYESMGRTALRLIDNDEPFNRIATTREWMMTTGLMSYLILTEMRAENSWKYDDNHTVFYHKPFNRDGVAFDESTPYATQVEHRTFYADRFKEDCDDPLESDGYLADMNRLDLTSMFFFGRGGLARNCLNEFSLPAFRDDYFSDWRPVELVPAGEDIPDYRDAPRLSRMTTLPLRATRTGYFGSPGFLASWPTNEDNSFRVTVNQALIVGLGLAFEALDDAPLPFFVQNLADEHAGPGTLCYSCHKGLDPMRNYFFNEFNPINYKYKQPEVTYEPLFDFRGFPQDPVAEAGGDQGSFGQHVANHPKFAEAWVQKICAFANSSRCDPDSAEFKAARVRFQDGFNFRRLWIDLFSSRLITETCVRGDSISISRQDHLCQTLRQRFGHEVCDDREEVGRDLPGDSWPRGATSPIQATDSSLFTTLQLTHLCGLAAIESEKDMRDSFSKSNPPDFAVLVEKIMAIPPGDALYNEAVELLTEHYTLALAESGGNLRESYKSMVEVACNSALIASMDL